MKIWPSENSSKWKFAYFNFFDLKIRSNENSTNRDPKIVWTVAAERKRVGGAPVSSKWSWTINHLTCLSLSLSLPLFLSPSLPLALSCSPSLYLSLSLAPLLSLSLSLYLPLILSLFLSTSLSLFLLLPFSLSLILFLAPLYLSPSCKNLLPSLFPWHSSNFHFFISCIRCFLQFQQLLFSKWSKIKVANNMNL